jgi:hypothetical protein
VGEGGKYAKGEEVRGVFVRDFAVSGCVSNKQNAKNLSRGSNRIEDKFGKM